MGEVGILTPDDRVELIRGEIITMSPQGRRHRAFIDNLNRVLNARLTDRAIVSVSVRQRASQGLIQFRLTRSQGGRDGCA